MNSKVITEEIVSLEIADAYRTAKTESGHRHGMGVLGEDIFPYLHHRVRRGTELGVNLVWPEDLRDIKVIRLKTEQEPRKNGRLPVEAQPWDALRAPDAPTLREAQALADDVRQGADAVES